MHRLDPDPFTSVCENMMLIMSSTKLVVHNILHCHQRRTKPQSQVTCIENLVKYERVVSKLCEHTNKQTDKHTYRHSNHNNKATPSVLIIRIWHYWRQIWPWTVMVHATDTTATYATMVSARRPVSLTLHAHCPTIVLQHFSNVSCKNRRSTLSRVPASESWQKQQNAKRQSVHQ